MPTLGISGGIASGKSSLAKYLVERWRADHFDADVVARQFLECDAEVRSLVLNQVSSLAYKADGTPDRERLRDVIFGDTTAKEALEAILHPRVRARWMAAIGDPIYAQRLLVVEIPLLFETQAQNVFSRVVVVACSRETQLARLVIRGLMPSLASRMIDSQMPTSQKIALARHVVWNDGDEDNLHAQAEELADL